MSPGSILVDPGTQSYSSDPLSFFDSGSNPAQVSETTCIGPTSGRKVLKYVTAPGPPREGEWRDLLEWLPGSDLGGNDFAQIFRQK